MTKLEIENRFRSQLKELEEKYLLAIEKKPNNGKLKKIERNHKINKFALIFLKEQEQDRLENKNEAKENIEKKLINGKTNLEEVRKEWYSTLNIDQVKSINGIIENITEDVLYLENKINNNTSNLIYGGNANILEKIIPAIQNALITHETFIENGRKTPFAAKLSSILSGLATNEYKNILGGGSRSGVSDVMKVLSALKDLEKNEGFEQEIDNMKEETEESTHLDHSTTEKVPQPNTNSKFNISEIVKNAKEQEEVFSIINNIIRTGGKTEFYKNIKIISSELIKSNIDSQKIKTFLEEKIETLGYSYSLDNTEYEDEENVDHNIISQEDIMLYKEEEAEKTKILSDKKIVLKLESISILVWLKKEMGPSAFNTVFPNGEMEIIKNRNSLLEYDYIQDKEKIVLTSKTRRRVSDKFKRSSGNLAGYKSIYKKEKKNENLKIKMLDMYLYKINGLSEEEDKLLFREMINVSTGKATVEVQELYDSLNRKQFLRQNKETGESELTSFGTEKIEEYMKIEISSKENNKKEKTLKKKNITIKR